MGASRASGGKAAWFRRPFDRLASSPPLLAGVLVFTMAFGLYGATTAQSLGYDPETSAVAEGLVRSGEPRILDESPLRSGGTQGRGGHLYGRTGLLQPILEAPFYAAGWAWDAISSDSQAFNHRQLVLMPARLDVLQPARRGARSGRTVRRADPPGHRAVRNRAPRSLTAV